MSGIDAQGTVALAQISASQMAVTQAVGSTKALQRHAKLEDAAEKFEGMMLQELLKPMQEGKDGAFGGFGGGFGTDGEDRDGSLDTMSSYGTEAVANAIAKQGGLGIAKQVMRQIGNVDESKKEKSSSTKVSYAGADEVK